MTDIEHNSLKTYLDQVSARKSTPGGGAVAAIVAAEGCALMNMVANFSDGEEFEDIVGQTSDAIEALLKASENDQAAFRDVMKAYRGEADRSPALTRAALVPVEIINICAGRLEHLETLASRGNANLISDVAIAALLFDSAIKSSELNILINLRELDTPPEPAARAMHDLPAISARLQYIISTVRTGLSD